MGDQTSVEVPEIKTDNLHSTYLMYPRTESQLGETNLYKKSSFNIFDYLNLMFYGGGAVLVFYYLTESFDSMGYIMFCFSILVFCGIMS